MNKILGNRGRVVNFSKNVTLSLIAQILGGVVILGGLIVMVGWFFDINVLKSILPMWVSMKFITAFSFFICGIIVILIARNDGGNKEYLEFFALILSFVVLLLMFSFFISLFLGISVGVENLFVKEQVGTVRTTVPGVPAVPTIICFILVAICEFFVFANNNNNNNNKVVFLMGVLVSIIGGVAILGYIFNVPVLYYSFEGYTSMAFHTAILFVLLGVSLMFSSKEKIKILNGTLIK
jgi:hypothetical protein